MATPYTYTIINIPGASATLATAINDSGEVVGDYENSTGTGFNGFIDHNGTYTTISVPGAGSTQSNAINASGEIAGLYTDSTGHAKGYIDDKGVFTTINSPYLNSYAISINDSGEVIGEPGYVYDKGVFATLNAPGAVETDTDAINNSGNVVGSYYDTNPFAVHGFVYYNGIFTTFDPPGSTATFATAINNSGVVVGYDLVDASKSGFIDQNGAYTTINPAGSTATIPTGINASGEVVGYYYDSSDTVLGFIYDKGTYTTIAPKGSTETILTGINASGEVVGYYYDSSGEHGFTASPKGHPAASTVGDLLTSQVSASDLVPGISMTGSQAAQVRTTTNTFGPLDTASSFGGGAVFAETTHTNIVGILTGNG